jgi:hypothetical protein
VAVYSSEDYFGITSDQMAAADALSPQSPNHTYVAGSRPGGQLGTVASFTEWRRSPVFWLAVFGVFALGMIHLEGSVRASFR